ncbi:MAG: ABC-type transport auxiliary lipoprotein family protein [Steroidobacteraceae bacterium]
MRNVSLLLPLLSGLLALTACFSGLNSKTPAQQRYVLQLPATLTPEPEARAAPAMGAVQVMRPAVAPGLATEGIAVLRSGARLDYYSNARWAADAPSALQSLIIESLRHAGRFAMVEAEGGPFASQYLLSLDLTHFEARYGADGPPTIEVELVASLGRRSDRSMLRSFTAHSDVRAQADRMQAVIAAFEQATGEALAQISAGATPQP